MAKQYGLIIPKLQKHRNTAKASLREIGRPKVFDESSSDSLDSSKSSQLKLRIPTVSTELSVVEKKISRTMYEKALAEDSTVFQYDELYDKMKNEYEKKLDLIKKPKKPKYIDRLLKCAERRKLEYELRIERQVQKEREKEGDEFKGKEKFVTTAYRKKLEEIRVLEEQEKQDEYLETIGDVTKQADLDGFYRHLYEQRLGSAKKICKPSFSDLAEKNENKFCYKPITSGRKCAYRKRLASVEKDQQLELENFKKEPSTKNHLGNNIDADSDFSIDSSTSSKEDEQNHKPCNDNIHGKKKNIEIMASNKGNIEKERGVIGFIQTGAAIVQNRSGLKLGDKPEKKRQQNLKANFDRNKSKAEVLVEKFAHKVKNNKVDIWKKRTKGEAFDVALQRYYIRKEALNS